MRIADVVAQTLAAHGVRHAFGMPGGEVVTCLDALNAAGVTFHLARHETAASFMAAGTHALSGQAGVLLTTVGPGLANAVNGIADAMQEQVPLIVISGVVDHEIRGRYTHQVVDQAALLRPLVKASFEVEANGAGQLVARAIALATTRPFGPVHIDIAPGTAALLASAEDRPVSPVHAVLPRLDADDAGLVDIAERLNHARRPLMLVGYEVVQSSPGHAITQIAEALRCPVLTSYKAKGVINEDHPLSLGAIGLSPLADGIVLKLVQQADVVLLVGFDPIELRQGWLNPFAATTTVIDVTASAADHGMYTSHHRVTAPLSSALSWLAASCHRDTKPWPNAEPDSAKSALVAAFSAPEGWSAASAVAAIQSALPEQAIVTVDSGAHRILLSQMLHVAQPGGLLQSAGFCTMGAAVPLAIGAKLAAPERDVIAVLGDGGLEMCLGELATIRDLGLAITIVVFQDESLALIELKQGQAGLLKAGVQLGRTPFEDIATAYGGSGIRVTSREALVAAMHAGANRETFSLIVCDIEAADYVDRI